ncbi:hypothetical protein CROQUDRAFT_98865 [Cronartium quercuum f. sp. fusiforme G11]|uniref:Uncharacterized protein n=1 Tax=Cronartium quercuum f. sp. fusiforme G11 TaxID=708437 RepID=A0A9P6T6Z4_9BASI|nr:hypothetical protein CROQUDRAFT_98865 [Cronartium quercuum f. sp. fusiforme G11]
METGRYNFGLKALLVPSKCIWIRAFYLWMQNPAQALRRCEQSDQAAHLKFEQKKFITKTFYDSSKHISRLLGIFEPEPPYCTIIPWGGVPQPDSP